MPAGLETFNPDGTVQLTYTDRTCKVMGSGTVNLPVYPENARTVVVQWPGMKNDGTWFVVATEYTNVVINNGSFKLYRCDQFYNEPNAVYYTVIKL